MSKEYNTGNYRLTVPLDASGIENFKPEKGVKVGVQDRKGQIHSQVVRLDAKGHGVATFRFHEQPGALRLIVGPEDASDEELTGLQTLTADVDARQWKARKELDLSAIRITPYYWWWWWRWCRTFTINGRILCPDGSPVPGAVVCAYDVDWWWWWLSQQQVGNCATTDATGSFTITFRWCCGWWPWWWWRYRYWQYEPLLAERILPILQRDPTLGRLRGPSPTPDLKVFDNLLVEKTGLARASRGAISSEATSDRIFVSANRKTSRASSPANIDPSALASLRDKLVARLPAAPELERLRLWPWWPWYPWWDCSPDIIFRATQDCVEQNKVIVNETVWQTRWDIPTTLNVTLTATDACCIPVCNDPADCPDGECIVISQACDDPLSNIGGNVGAPATPVGYVNPGQVSALGDRPYAGQVPISGVFGSGAGVDYYEFEWATSSAGPWNPLPPAASSGFSREYWGPQLPAGPVNWYWVPFTFTTISGRNVVETREHFEATNGAGSWGVSRFWVYNRDLLMVWLTNGNFADGTYYLRARGWDLVAGNLTNDRILPICDTENENYLVLTIDNRTTDGTDGHPAANTPGHPCGSGTVHLCTMEPDTDIVNVTIGGQVVGPCTNVQAAPGSPLVVDFYAYDPDGHLSQYSLIATYGENLYRDLLGLADSIVPLGGTAVPAAAQVGPDYGVALGQGATSPIWRGGAVRLTINDSSVAFPEPCCYQLELRAYKRTIVDCYDGLGHNNLSEYSFGVNACP
ncbi:MAG: carboxypeptidase-like regulatory domain-containing protein [Pyrinomonadaceae bacterium]